VCRGCGAYTQPRNGKGDADAYAWRAIRARLSGAGRGSWWSRRCWNGVTVTADALAELPKSNPDRRTW